MDNVIGYVLMAVISLPISFFLARGCLQGVVRLMSGSVRRDVL
jgi:hypothetical protein